MADDELMDRQHLDDTFCINGHLYALGPSPDAQALGAEDYSIGDVPLEARP